MTNHGGKRVNYHFDEPINRRDTHSLKWSVPENELPMWVADMDFLTAPEIILALQKRAAHGIFGYTIVPEQWYQAYLGWWSRRHGFHMEKEWLLFCTGVVPAISSIVRKLTMPGEHILVLTPVYNIFFNSILNNGRCVLESPLRYDGESYEVDFDDLERKLALPQTTMMILCNPHNPVGKVWSRETLERIGELCRNYNVMVISDEIHCDLTASGCNYIPFASVSENCRENSITCVAPTKAFNLAGLQTAAVIIPNETLRHKADRGINTDEIAEPNAFAIEAAIAALTEGEPWLTALLEYIESNKCFAEEFLERELPQLKAVSAQATYLLWIDCSKILANAAELSGFLREHTGLYLSAGNQYGGNGDNFLRMNIACSRQLLKEGLVRLKSGISAYKKTSYATPFAKSVLNTPYELCHP